MIYILAYCIGAMPVEQCKEPINKPLVRLYSDKKSCREDVKKLKVQYEKWRVVRRCEELP